MVSQVQGAALQQTDNSDPAPCKSSRLTRLNPVPYMSNTVYTLILRMSATPADDKLTHKQAIVHYSLNYKKICSSIDKYNKTYRNTRNAGHTGLGFKKYPQGLTLAASREELVAAKNELIQTNMKIIEDIKSVKSSRN